MSEPSFTPDSPMEAGISVILCCYNSAGRLAETLKHLARQSVPKAIPWEVILVNNASTDDTAAVAVRVWQESGGPTALRILNEKKPGKSFALNTGFTAARHGLLVTVDDDNWLEEDYLRIAHEIMSIHPEIGALGGSVTAHFEEPPPPWFKEVESCYAVGAQGGEGGDITDYKPHVAGAGMILRKSAYLNLLERGFNFSLRDREKGKLTAGGDTELCYALALCGYHIWYDQRLKLEHFMPAVRLTKSYFWELARGIRSAGPALACYEIALRGGDTSPWWFYLRRVFLLGW